MDITDPSAQLTDSVTINHSPDKIDKGSQIVYINHVTTQGEYSSTWKNSHLNT